MRESHEYPLAYIYIYMYMYAGCEVFRELCYVRILSSFKFLFAWVTYFHVEDVSAK